MAMRGNGATAGVLVVAGAILGAGLALLAAPRSGEDTRRVLAITARRAGRRSRRMADDVTYTAGEMADRVGDRAEAIVDRSREILRGAKREISAALEEGQERLGRQRERLSKILD